MQDHNGIGSPMQGSIASFDQIVAERAVLRTASAPRLPPYFAQPLRRTASVPLAPPTGAAPHGLHKAPIEHSDIDVSANDGDSNIPESASLSREIRAHEKDQCTVSAAMDMDTPEKHFRLTSLALPSTSGRTLPRPAGDVNGWKRLCGGPACIPSAYVAPTYGAPTIQRDIVNADDGNSQANDGIVKLDSARSVGTTAGFNHPARRGSCVHLPRMSAVLATMNTPCSTMVFVALDCRMFSCRRFVSRLSRTFRAPMPPR